MSVQIFAEPIGGYTQKKLIILQNIHFQKKNISSHLVTEKKNAGCIIINRDKLKKYHITCIKTLYYNLNQISHV